MDLPAAVKHLSTHSRDTEPSGTRQDAELAWTSTWPPSCRTASAMSGQVLLAGRLRSLLRSRPLADRRGTAILEFAFVAVPFLFLTFGILELGLIYVANINLSNSALTLARKIRVGSLVAPGVAATSSSGTIIDLNDFKAALCSNIALVPSSTCLNQIQVDLKTQTSFTGAGSPSPFSGKIFNSKSFCFYSGSSGSVVTMNVYYLWPVQTPLLLTALVRITIYTTPSRTSTGGFFVLSATEVCKSADAQI